MAHLHTKTGEHDLTVSAYILHQSQDGVRIWLHMHKKIGKWLPFGGHVEWSETPWQAVLHEIEEESGYVAAQLRILQPTERIAALTGATLHPQPVCVNTHQIFDPTVTGDHFHTDIVYAFIAKELPEHAIGEGESATIQMFDEDELAGLDMPDNAKEIACYALREIAPNWWPADLQDFIA